MSTETIFNISVALSNLLMLLATALVQVDATSKPSERAARAYYLAAALSWLIFVFPPTQLQWLSWVLATLSNCMIGLLCSYRAGLPPRRAYLAAVALLSSASYAWCLERGSLPGVMHTASLVYLLILTPAMRDLARKSQRSRSDALRFCGS